MTDLNPHRFEAQLTAVKDRLEAAKAGSSRNTSNSTNNSTGFNFGGAGSRIAKPLRGGGGGAGDYVNGNGPNIPVLSGLQAQEANGSPSGGGGAGGAKRSSWFFDPRR